MPTANSGSLPRLLEQCSVLRQILWKMLWKTLWKITEKRKIYA
jgi:hypothetical protein